MSAAAPAPGPAPAAAAGPLVSFTFAGSRLAAPLGTVAEVVRLGELTPLPGMRPPLAGLLDLRGRPLPVIDVRPAPGPGDVLVVDGQGGGPYGLAVDSVLAVVEPGECTVEELPAGLPDYVVGLLRDGTGPLLLVDVAALSAGAGP